MQTAKVFKNGNSQAIRLPKEFRVEGNKVGISHLGNAILLQPLPGSWLEVYAAMSELPDFMDDYEDEPPEERESF